MSYRPSMYDLDDMTMFVSDGIRDQLGCGDVIPLELLDVEIRIERKHSDMDFTFEDRTMCYDLLNLDTQLNPKGVY